jgi:hypothetical protein
MRERGGSVRTEPDQGPFRLFPIDMKWRSDDDRRDSRLNDDHNVSLFVPGLDIAMRLDDLVE